MDPANEFFRRKETATEVADEHASEVLTLKDAAAFLHCSQAHLSHLLAGKVGGVPALPHVRLGRRVLIRRQALLLWLAGIETKLGVE